MKKMIKAIFIVMFSFYYGSLNAQTPELNVQTFMPSPHSLDLFHTEGVRVNHTVTETGFFMFNYVANPFKYTKNGVDYNVVKSLATLDLLTAVSFLDRFSVGLDMPLHLFRSGETIASMTNAPNASGFSQGDLRLSLKATPYRPDYRYGIGMAFGFDLITPTGAKGKYTAEKGFGIYPKILFESVTKSAQLLLNIGWLHRTKEIAFDNKKYRDEIITKVGVGIPFVESEVAGMSLEAEFSSKPTEFFKDAYTRLELGGGFRFLIKKMFMIGVGAGAGILKGLGDPAYRVWFTAGYAPRVYKPEDSDKDGIKDPVDKCPLVPEDKDGFEDSDGCPDPDNDKDGICDPWVAKFNVSAKYAKICVNSDKCPMAPEDKDGFEDSDGCPDPDNDKDGICDPWVTRKGLSKKYKQLCKMSDKCPDQAEDFDNFEDSDGCPEIDNDKDGIPDKSDKCPNVAEDKDGFEDSDGCPDPDNDKDKICDPWVAKSGLSEQYKKVCAFTDACPMQPEVYNGFNDEDGCPDTKPLVFISKKKIIITQKVYFKKSRSKILRKSYKLLNSVVEILQQHPEIKLVSVEGHTSSEGSYKYNKKLSKRRAKSIVKYLRRKGINKNRLQYKGWGPDKPLTPIPEKNEAEREKNRRVEFIILGQ